MTSQSRLARSGIPYNHCCGKKHFFKPILPKYNLWDFCPNKMPIAQQIIVTATFPLHHRSSAPHFYHKICYNHFFSPNICKIDHACSTTTTLARIQGLCPRTTTFTRIQPLLPEYIYFCPNITTLPIYSHLSGLGKQMGGYVAYAA